MGITSCGGQSEVVSGSLFIRKVRLQVAGESVGGHAHSFDHTTMVLRGRLAVVMHDPSTRAPSALELRAGDHMLVAAGVVHELTAIEDDCEFWCVYSHRDAHGRIAETFQGLAATQ